MARQTKATKFARLAQGIENIRKGKRPMPKIRADGSVGTKPCVWCPDLPEDEVMDEVLEWLTRHGCKVRRLNNGFGSLMDGQGRASEPQAWGMKGGGDYIGMLPDGTHLEVEVKRGSGGRLSKSQVKQRGWVLSGKGVYVVVHGVPELKAKLLPILEKLLDNQGPPW